MSDKKKTVEELLKEFHELLISGDPFSGRNAGTKLHEAANDFIRQKVYDADKHAQLGEHVEAIMKHFKGL